jgi:hypothetical protein
MSTSDPHHEMSDPALRRAAAAYAAEEPSRRHSPFSDPEFRRRLDAVAAIRATTQGVGWWRRALAPIADAPRLALASAALSITLILVGGVSSGEAARQKLSLSSAVAAAPVVGGSAIPSAADQSESAAPLDVSDDGEGEVSLLLAAGVTGLAATLTYLAARRWR